MEWWVAAAAANLALVAASVAVGIRNGRRLRRLRREEAEDRHRRALAIHDDVVQGLATAKLSLELGETTAGMAALDETLAAARHLVTDLLGGTDDPSAVVPGSLRRTAAAGPA